MLDNDLSWIDAPVIEIDDFTDIDLFYWIDLSWLIYTILEWWLRIYS